MRPERVCSPAVGASGAPASHAPASHAPASHAPDPSRVLVIGCGALARELVAVIDQAGLDNVDLTCLPATLHNRPGGIPAAVLAKIRAARPRYERIYIAYADCGTGGLLDRVLRDEGVERLPGAHCYEFYSGSPAFEAITDEDPATFFLTDFLARNFDRLVIEGLGLDRHPELLPIYFGNYHRLVYLAQTDDPALVEAARRAARRLGLAFALRQTGYGDLATSIVAAARTATPARPTDGAAPEAATEAAQRTRRRSAFSSDPSDDPVAAGASNNARAPFASTESADSLCSVQVAGPNLLRRDKRLRPGQGRGGPRSAERRWLHPVQGRAGILRGAQERARTAAAETMPAPATTAAVSTPQRTA